MKSMKRLWVWTWAALAALPLGAFLMAQGSGFRFDGPRSRVVTPNGDNLNDRVIFCFGNLADSEVEGRIYTVLGSEVARLSRIPANGVGCPPAPLLGTDKAQHMTWDGRQDGSPVASGVYVYRIQSEGMTYSGSIVVVR